MASEKHRHAKRLIINEARTVLRGEHRGNKDLNDLCSALEAIEQFSYATDILLTRIEQEKKEGLAPKLSDYQKLAKYIYKDQSLPSTFKFERALKELQVNDPQDAGSFNCETLGLMGAIYKRKWQFDNKRKNLELSCHYYQEGYKCWRYYIDELKKKKAGENSNPDGNLNDDGYTAVNFAYVSELIALTRIKELGSVMSLAAFAVTALTEVDETRRFILDQLLNNPGDSAEGKDWITASIAETYFGLKQYDRALEYSVKFIQGNKKQIEKQGEGHIGKEELLSWKIKTFTQQMFSLAGLQLELRKYIEELEHKEKTDDKNFSADPYLKKIKDEIKESELRKCLAALDKSYAIEMHNKAGKENEAELLQQALNSEGKYGLALSGGGFRASIFHIGVLAALAEHNKLKDVEVISCVSGGSIIGAYYYIKLKNLLESKTNAEITQEDYIKLVQEVEKKFIKGVQKNLRMRIFSNLWCNFKMLGKNYSRTHRLGELYEKHLYNGIFNWKEKKEKHEKHIYISDLFIRPKAQPDFSITNDNWKRRNKIPQLILNATSVNTGHNWQFTASWMGEPPGNINDDIDVKPRLRRMYYGDAPGRYKKFRLGYAVGASSCVPVMFEPLLLRDLYPGFDLQLIDGGLNDNQGIASLVEQECKNVFISDASGQLPSDKNAAGGGLSLFFRADNILQERVREIQFMDMRARYESSQLSGLATVHLKCGLLANPVSWKDCDEPPRKLVYEKNCPQDTDLTPYGVLRPVQEKLSEIRTDLDSFNDTEANALMYTAYVQTCYTLGVSPDFHEEEMEVIKGEYDGKKEGPRWGFLRIRKQVSIPARSGRTMKILSVGKELAFKVFHLSVWVRIFAFAVLAGAAVWPVMWLYENRKEKPFDNITIGTLVFIVLIIFIKKWSKWLAAIIDLKGTVHRIIAKASAVVVGFVVCNFYVWLLNPLYNLLGKLKK